MIFICVKINCLEVLSLKTRTSALFLLYDRKRKRQAVKEKEAGGANKRIQVLTIFYFCSNLHYFSCATVRWKCKLNAAKEYEDQNEKKQQRTKVLPFYVCVIICWFFFVLQSTCILRIIFFHFMIERQYVWKNDFKRIG